jgi:hypothetical protein
VGLDELLAALERDGLLLLSDPDLPSVVSLVVGGPIGGSWWGHPRGGEIYRLSNDLADQPQVLLAKLVSGKVTFVHRRLWPAVIAVGQARARWQLDGLSAAARALLQRVDDDGYVPWAAGSSTASVKVLERRLLIHAAEVHTPTGAHAKNLQTWPEFARTAGIAPPLPDVVSAWRQLEAALEDLNARYAARARLPWRASNV